MDRATPGDSVRWRGTTMITPGRASCLNLSWLPPPILTQPSRSSRPMVFRVLVSGAGIVLHRSNAHYNAHCCSNVKAHNTEQTQSNDRGCRDRRRWAICFAIAKTERALGRYDLQVRAMLRFRALLAAASTPGSLQKADRSARAAGRPDCASIRHHANQVGRLYDPLVGAGGGRSYRKADVAGRS